MKKLIFLFCSVLLVSGGTAYGQDKVVVIPMGSASKLEKNIYGGGAIAPDGSIFSSFGNPLTASHSGTGSYALFLAGLRPGCADPWPMALVSSWSAGFCYPFAMVTYCLSGDTYIYVNTTNAAGTAIDTAFNLLLLLPDTPTTAASRDKAAKQFTVCELNTATGAETCR